MIELNVPFLEKDEAKRLGARWNNATKRWYIPDGVDHNKFIRWLPEDFVAVSAATIVSAQQHTRTEYSLSAFLFKISDIIQNTFPHAAWISAEISELRLNKGHMFITLVEHDEQGNLMARSSARIWQSQVEAINHKFSQGTGSNLDAGIKVLVLARVEFHAQYGLALFIDDIDPTYTLGDMAAKLAKIREVLTAEKIINKNKEIEKPLDFVRVAVISPQNAAGLGDFNREAKILAKYNLCEFVYYTATFQGEAAPGSICQALSKAITEHANNSFDALVIIRGGGALSDLAWLNNEQLARAICLCPIHVMVGVGHERDYTILDEIAGERFDTPSKVIHRIFTVVTDNAIAADNSYAEIGRKIQHIYKYTDYVLEKLQLEITTAANNMLQRVAERIANTLQQIITQAKQNCLSIEKQLQLIMAEILSQSPKQILKKGFALVHASGNKVISSAQAAQQYTNLTIEFHDGAIQVTQYDKKD
jgi:exodeoxyribonuclease VII large subunit